MTVRTAIYVAACLVLPWLWSAIAAAIFRRLDRRASPPRRPDEPRPPDYHI